MPPRAAVELQSHHIAGDRIALSPRESRHLIQARRLGEGDAVEAFNAQTGLSASGVLEKLPAGWEVRLTAIPIPAKANATSGPTVFGAVPKGPRADWMVEKLAELAVARWVPLIASRSVVEPGHGRVARWRRLAIEAAKQSRAPTGLRVDDPVNLPTAISMAPRGSVVLSTERPCGAFDPVSARAVFIGPEGGWDEAELAAFEAAGLSFATLGRTVLRVETAALVAGALWATTARETHKIGP